MEIRRNMVSPQVQNVGQPTNETNVGEPKEMQDTSQNQGETEKNNIIVKFIYDALGKDIEDIEIIDDGKKDVTVIRTDIWQEAEDEIEKQLDEFHKNHQHG